MPTTICKSMMTETAHRLPDHTGRCFYIHGHSYKWEVMITSAQIGLNGMIMDFSDLKKVMHQAIDPFDHCLVLHEDDVNVHVSVPGRIGEQARIMLVPYIPTAENMAYAVWMHIRSILRSLDCKVTVRVWETTTSYAEYSEA